MAKKGIQIKDLNVFAATSERMLLEELELNLDTGRSITILGEAGVGSEVI